MRFAILALAVTLAATPALAAELTFPPGAVAREAALQPKLTPRAQAYVKSQGKAQAEMGVAATPASATQTLGPRLEGLDIDSLMFLVMMETARDADADMRDVMARMDAANARKQDQRDRKTKAPVTIGGEAARSPGGGGHPLNAGSTGGVAKDALSEMSQGDQMRLQQAMERYSKAMEALANVMKKSSDTSNAITGNLK